MTRLVLQLVSYAGLAIVVFIWFGVAVARLAWPRRLAPLRPLAVPVLGFAVLMALGHVLARLRLGTDGTAWLLVAAAAIPLLAYSRGVVPTRTGRPVRHGLVVAVLGIGITLAPLLLVGYVTVVGPEVDSFFYLSRARWFRQTGIATLPAPDRSNPAVDVLTASANGGARAGDQYTLAFLSSIADLDPLVLFPILMAVFAGMAGAGVYAMGRCVFRFTRAAALGGAALAVIQPLVLWVSVDNFLSQAAGMAVFPWALVALTFAVRRPDHPSVIAAGLLVTALAMTYPVYLPPLLAAGLLSGGFAAILVRRRAGGRAALAGAALSGTRALCLVAIVAVAISPLGWRMTFRTFTAFGGNAGALARTAAGNINTFPHVAEVIGLGRHEMLAYFEGITGSRRTFTEAVLFAGLAAALYGVLRTRPAGAAAATASAGALAAVALQQRFLMGGAGYPYGYFKIIALASPVAALLVGAGLSRALSDGRGPGIAGTLLRRTPLCAIGALFIGVVLANVAGTVRFASSNFLVADHDLLALGDAARAVPPGAPILVEDGEDLSRRSWAMYLLDRSDLFDQGQPSGIPAAPVRRAHRFPRWLLRLGPNAVVDGRYDVVRSSRRFVLAKRRDDVVAQVDRLNQSTGLPIDIRLSRHGVSLTGMPGADGPVHQAAGGEPQRAELLLSSTQAGCLAIESEAGRETFPLPAGESRVAVPVLRPRHLTLSSCGVGFPVLHEVSLRSAPEALPAR